MTTTYTFRLTPQARRDLARLARAMGRSKGDVLRVLMSEAVKTLDTEPQKFGTGAPAFSAPAPANAG